MNVLNVVVLFLSIFVAFGTGANAAKLIKSDPNAGSVPVANDTKIYALDQDARLSQPVSYSAKHVPLKTVVSDLSKQSGVILYSGWNSNDWMVRDRRMCIFVRDMPLRDLMRSIARTMHFQWSVTDANGQPSYRLLLDRKALLELTKRMSKAETDFQEKIKANRRKLLDSVFAMENISSNDMKKLKESNPYLYALEDSGAGKLIRLLCKEEPDAASSMLNGTNYYAMASDLSPQVRQALTDAARGYCRIFEGRGHGQKEYLNNLENTISTAWLRLYGNVWDGENASREQRLRELGSLLIKLGPKYNNNTAFFLAKLHPPDSTYDQRVSALYLKSRGDELFAQKMKNEDRDSLDSAWNELTKETGDLQPGDRPIDRPDEEWMHPKVDLTGYGCRKLRDVFQALAEAGGLCVVSDSYVLTKAVPKFDKSDTIGSVLKKIADQCDYNWDRHESTLELTDRYWPYKRGLQIPAEWVERWSGNTKRDKSLGFDDFVQIASLADEQIRENLTEDPVLGSRTVYEGIFSNLHRSRLSIRLYGVLSLEQRKLLWSSFGLPLQMLTPEQMKYAQVIIDETRDWGPPFAWCQSPDVCFRGSFTRDPEKGDKYTISLVLDNKEGNLYANYTMPTYTPPARSEQAESGDSSNASLIPSSNSAVYTDGSSIATYTTHSTFINAH